MSALDLRGIHVSAYAPPTSYRYAIRRRRAAHLRGWLLRPEIAGLLVALTLALILGLSNHFEVVRVLINFSIGAN